MLKWQKRRRNWQLTPLWITTFRYSEFSGELRVSYRYVNKYCYFVICAWKGFKQIYALPAWTMSMLASHRTARHRFLTCTIFKQQSLIVAQSIQGSCATFGTALEGALLNVKVERDVHTTPNLSRFWFPDIFLFTQGIIILSYSNGFVTGSKISVSCVTRFYSLSNFSAVVQVLLRRPLCLFILLNAFLHVLFH